MKWREREEAELQEKEKQLGVKVPCQDMLYLTPEVETMVLNAAESEEMSPQKWDPILASHDHCTSVLHSHTHKYVLEMSYFYILQTIDYSSL